MDQSQTVFKFGGTSMKTPASIKQVASIIMKHKCKVVVVSAVSGVTDLLVSFHQNYSLNNSSHILTETCDHLLHIHQSIAKELNLSEIVQLEIKTEIETLKKFPAGESLTTADLDEILSIGERLSSMILFSFLKSQAEKTQEQIYFLDAREIIQTDQTFGKAIPHIANIKELAKTKLKNLPNFEQSLFITQGFIGKSINGKTTTLGRGGSDFSAALFAEAIEANHLYIYTDVPGVYSIDPNLVPKAKLIPEISFQEMAEMANFGAKILHPATLAPCLRAQIPVTILSTFEPDLKGTLVTIHSPSNSVIHSRHPLVRSITMRKKQVLVTIKSLNMLNAYGFLANIFTILSKYKISVDLITTSEVSVALTIDGTSLGSHSINPFTNPKLIEELEQFSDITLEDHLTLIAVVGPTLTGPGIAQQIFAELSDIQVRAICYGASASSIGILVSEDVAKNVATIMHEKLIEKVF